MKKNAFFLLLAGILTLAGCTPGRMLIYGFSDLKDYKKFPSREISAPAEAFEFARNDDYVVKHDVRVTHNARRNQIDSLLAETPTVAFLIIRNDTILYENYLKKYDENSIIPSFSMAKSFTSALTGIAVEEGYIGSIQDSMTQYLTELQGKGMGDIKISHLLQMTTGIKHAENYFNPFAGVAKLYYGRNIRNQIKHLKMELEPGFYWKYKSINTQLLGMVVERATGKTLSEYLQEKIWMKIGMESDASWSLDKKKNGVEKAYCCINAITRDFAKFGRLYLNEGNWNGEQVIDAEWVKNSTKIDAKDGAYRYYQYQWWLPSAEGDFCAQGHLGQFIYVHPEKNVIIVRLGKKYGDVGWMEAFREIAKQL